MTADSASPPITTNPDGQRPPVDVLINVFAKPYQTALSLLSLFKWSGQHLDRLYFHEEPATSEYERRDQRGILKWFSGRIIHYRLPLWLSAGTTDEVRLKTDEAYRLSTRYQYGWEHSDNRFALIIHNDIQVTGDIVGELLGAIGEATAAGEIGQCWWCPAGQGGLCSSERYTEFRPKYHQLMYLYNQGMDYYNRRAYNLGLRDAFKTDPWPLPECRVNEWCMLVNLEKARPATQPFGPATPLGALIASGAKIGENWDEDVDLDTGVQWFRDLNHLGHAFRHYPVERHVIHDRRGNVTLCRPELYMKNELAARDTLRAEFPEFFATL